MGIFARSFHHNAVFLSHKQKMRALGLLELIEGFVNRAFNDVLCKAQKQPKLQDFYPFLVSIPAKRLAKAISSTLGL